MHEYVYDKVVRGYKLSEELRAADFQVETIYSKYNYDDPSASEPYCKVVLAESETKDPTAIVDAHDPYTGTEQEEHEVELAQKANDTTHQGLIAYNNWDSLNLFQKDAVLKNILWYILYKEGLL